MTIALTILGTIVGLIALGLGAELLAGSMQSRGKNPFQ